MDFLAAATSLGGILLNGVIEKTASGTDAVRAPMKVRAEVYESFQRQVTFVIADVVRLQTIVETISQSPARQVLPITAAWLHVAAESRWPDRLKGSEFLSRVVLSYGLANHVNDLVVQREVREIIRESQDKIAELLATNTRLRMIASAPVRSAAQEVLRAASEAFENLPGPKPTISSVVVNVGRSRRDWPQRRADFDTRLATCGDHARAFARAAWRELHPRRRWWQLRWHKQPAEPDWNLAPDFGLQESARTGGFASSVRVEAR